MDGISALRRQVALFVVALFATLCVIPQPSTAEILGGTSALHSIAKKKKRKRTKRRRKRRKSKQQKAAEAAAAAKAEAAAAAPAPPPPPVKKTVDVEPVAPSHVGLDVVTPHPVAPHRAAPITPPVGALPGDGTPQVYGPIEALWGGFFLSLNVGYATSGGEPGPTIPQPTGGRLSGVKVNNQSWDQWAKTPCTGGFGERCYAIAVTTDAGAGLAAAFQVGYNVAGYVSFWGDLSWHGSFGSKTETGGVGTVAVMLGFHPLRFWRPDPPFDLKLYGGYGLFEILYYYETQLDALMEAKGKSWMGNSIPFGLSFEYRIPDSVFALGADLRFVRGSYHEWVYNYDNDQKSEPSTPVTTFRFEPRAIMAWHF